MVPATASGQRTGHGEGPFRRRAGPLAGPVARPAARPYAGRRSPPWPPARRTAARPVTGETPL